MKNRPIIGINEYINLIKNGTNTIVADNQIRTTLYHSKINEVKVLSTIHLVLNSNYFYFYTEPFG